MCNLAFWGAIVLVGNWLGINYSGGNYVGSSCLGDNYTGDCLRTGELDEL